MTTNTELLGIVADSLRRGRCVDIEGLGRLSQQGERILLKAPSRPLVFVAYAQEDFALAKRLCHGLRAGGCDPWLDKEKLLPGQNWPRSIERAIEIADTFVACFSHRSTVKHGTFQSELRYALDAARRVPLDETFLIPARFEDCSVPARIAIHTQWVDLFPDWDAGMERLVASIKDASRNGTKRRSLASLKIESEARHESNHTNRIGSDARGSQRTRSGIPRSGTLRDRERREREACDVGHVEPDQRDPA